MAITENSDLRFVVEDRDGDILRVYGPEYDDGSVTLICEDRNGRDGTAVLLEAREVLALIGRLQGLGSRCPACLDHPGWATQDLGLRRDPADVCKTCLGAGKII